MLNSLFLYAVKANIFVRRHWKKNLESNSKVTKSQGHLLSFSRTVKGLYDGTNQNLDTSKSLRFLKPGWVIVKIWQVAVNIWIFWPKTCCWESSSNLAKKFRLNIMASPSVEWFCLGRKTKIPIITTSYHIFTLIQTSF